MENLSVAAGAGMGQPAKGDILCDRRRECLKYLVKPLNAEASELAQSRAVA